MTWRILTQLPGPNPTKRKGPEQEHYPRLELTTKAYQKIHYWTHCAEPKECSGLGVVRKLDSRAYIVDDVYLIKPEMQRGLMVDMDPVAIQQLICEIYEKTPNRLQNLRFLWHTHGNCGVGWSGTDDKTCREVLCPDADWTINLVVNTQGHHLARMDFPKTKEEPIHGIPVYLRTPIYENKRAQLQEEYDLKHSSQEEEDDLFSHLPG